MRKIIYVFAVFLVVFLISGCGKKDKQEVSVSNNTSENVNEEKEEKFVPYTPPEKASKITGLACDNYDKRAFAVMYSGSSDAAEYRKNLDKADFVLEMPHRMHNEPRLMGVFQCNVPDALGPMRSGRIDFMSVADSLGAVFVPWGKSVVTAAAMEKGFVDNIEVWDGLRASDGTRAGFIDWNIKMSTARPAFADLRGVIKIAKEKGYSGENLFKEGFKHQGEIAIEKRPDYGVVDVKFGHGKFRIKYHYDKQTNSYKRYYDGKPSIDHASGEQYAPKNIIGIVTKRDSWLAEKDYTAEGLLDPWDGVPKNHVESNQYPNMQLGDPWFDTVFEGEAKFFMNGKYIKGTWKRNKGKNQPFHFYDEDGEEIHFVPGQIWMHVLPHGQRVSYEDAEERDQRLKEEQESKQNISPVN